MADNGINDSIHYEHDKGEAEFTAQTILKDLHKAQAGFLQFHAHNMAPRVWEGRREREVHAEVLERVQMRIEEQHDDVGTVGDKEEQRCGDGTNCGGCKESWAHVAREKKRKDYSSIYDVTRVLIEVLSLPRELS